MGRMKSKTKKSKRQTEARGGISSANHSTGRSEQEFTSTDKRHKAGRRHAVDPSNELYGVSYPAEK